jgi:hypothetical protein
MNIGVALVFVGIGMLIAGVVAGVFLFSPAKAAAVVATESDDPAQIGLVVDRIIAKRRRYIPAKRAELDRHPDYVATHLGVFFLSLGLIFGRIPHGTALFGLPPLLQHALATALAVSAFCGLLGIGLRLKDNRLSYTLGLCGSLGIMLAMGSYEVVIVAHSDLIGTLGGGLALSITGARMWMVPRFWREILSLNWLRARISGQIDDES